MSVWHSTRTYSTPDPRSHLAPPRNERSGGRDDFSRPPREKISHTRILCATLGAALRVNTVEYQCKLGSRECADTVRNKILDVDLMANALTRTLFRELMRTTQQLERATREHSAPLVARALGNMELRQQDHIVLLMKTYQGASWQHPLAASCVRQAFRARTASPHAIDDAFTALRVGNEVVRWLTVNDKLHKLHAEGADVVDGVCMIADVLQERHVTSDAAAPCRLRVEGELDAIAATVRARLEDPSKASSSPAGRLRTIQVLNSVLFEDLGFRGDYDDVQANSSIAEALTRRRGLPITLCAVIMGVARRLGLDTSFTNFPGHVLLRLEPETDANANDGARGAADSKTSEPTTAASERLDGAGGESCLSAADLHGLFWANYGAHGPEVVEVAEDGCNGGGLVATKITGDVNVPAGQRSWSVAVPMAAADEQEAGRAGHEITPGEIRRISIGDKLPAMVQVADAGFRDAREVEATMEVRSASTILLQIAADAEEDHGGAPASAPPPAPLLFQRCEARDLWFIDAFDKGKLLPVESLRHFLTVRVALPPTQHASHLEGVPAACVWARMCRNLAMHARREGDVPRANFWECVESGLDEVVVKHDHGQQDGEETDELDGEQQHAESSGATATTLDVTSTSNR